MDRAGTLLASGDYYLAVSTDEGEMFANALIRDGAKRRGESQRRQQQQ
jgi:hypothetical protein